MSVISLPNFGTIGMKLDLDEVPGCDKIGKPKGELWLLAEVDYIVIV